MIESFALPRKSSHGCDSSHFSSTPADCDVTMSAGYRSVLLNIRIVTKETEMLACETHICEVQLVLRAFGEVKDAEGNSRLGRIHDLMAD